MTADRLHISFTLGHRQTHVGTATRFAVRLAPGLIVGLESHAVAAGLTKSPVRVVSPDPARWADNGMLQLQRVIVARDLLAGE